MRNRADYGSHSVGGRGGIIASVEAGSPADAGGLSAGDKILSADGQPLRDVIDWRWLADGSEIVVVVTADTGAEREVPLSREPGQTWGFEFEDVLFDRVRTCANDCVFCFMKQLPEGLREPLYVRDDDYRLSFLQGNFVTLTNLSDKDVERILEQHLSPLYVSLHAVEPDVRACLVCAKRDRALERLDTLLESGIDVHVQVVLVPGVNDGEHLDATLRWLAEREGIVSVGIVPVGYTRHQSEITRSYNASIAAATVIEQVQRWQFEMMERDGTAWVHLADEFYLNASAPIPTAHWYDGFPQYENGIGIVRSFIDDMTELRESFEFAVTSLPPREETVTIVSGVLAATTLAGALEAVGAVGRARLLVVPNAFFGGNVTVTGLLTGTDLVAALKHDVSARKMEAIGFLSGDGRRGRSDRAGVYLLPDILFNADGLTLDDMTLLNIVESSGADVRLVSSDAHGLLAGLEDVSAEFSSRC